MPTSDVSWSANLRIVGDLERPDHYYLTDKDTCAFFGEYTARAGFAHSLTNQIIHNLKKKPETRHTPQWKHKVRTIREVGEAIAANLDAQALGGDAAFVPIPPSKLIGSSGYDNRMTQVARAIGSNVDVREALYAVAEREPMHTNPEVYSRSRAQRQPLVRPSLATSNKP
jgi:hypothetical protein